MARGTLAVLTMAVPLGLTGCPKSPEEPEAGQGGAGGDVLSVYVVNYPLKYFAERIGGGHVAVSFPVPADEDPAFWMPEPETIAAYQQADVILLNGATYAKWVDRVSVPESKLCDTSSSFTKEHIPLEEAATHSHGPEGEHTHGDVAFTTWLDPKLAIEHEGMDMKLCWLNWIVIVLLVLTPCAGSDYWVSPSGDDSARGTQQQPVLTIQHAVDQATLGDTVWVRAGRYEECVWIDAGKGGADGKWLTISAAPGDEHKVVVGFETPRVDAYGSMSSAFSMREVTWRSVLLFFVQLTGDLNNPAEKKERLS